MFRIVAAILMLTGVVEVMSGQIVKPAAEDMRHNLQTGTTNITMESAGTPPFRLEAKFETFSFDGKPDGEGTLKEEWLNAGNRRRVITFRGVTWTQTFHAGSARASGESFRGSFMERTVINALLEPGPTAEQIAGGAPEYKTLKLGTVPLDCVLLNPLTVSENASLSEKASTGYCLSQTPLLLRLVQERFGILVGYNRFAQLGAHYLPKEVIVSTGAQNRAALHVTSFSTAPALKESDFATPAEADMSAADIQPAYVDSGVLKGTIVAKTTPRYPEADKQNHVSGNVFLHALIDETGAIKELEVLSAPSKTLAVASLGAVKQWKYRPYLLNGQPISVDTTITVNFSFSQ